MNTKRYLCCDFVSVAAGHVVIGFSHSYNLGLSLDEEKE